MTLLISPDELRTLVDVETKPCVSIFLRLRRTPAEQDKNRIRLKNLLTQARQILQEQGMRTPDALELLSPAARLIEHGRFWAERDDGLAVFLAPGFSRIYSLPIDFEEAVWVNTQFQLTPLMPLFTGNGRYYVLALSQNELRLLHGTRYTIEDVDLPELPRSLEEALKWDDPESQLQFHTQTAPAPIRGRRRAIFHGHGVGAQIDHKDDILRYFQQINAGLQQILAEEDAPLVLAGVDYLFPLYRQANEYPYLLETGIPGNPELWSARELQHSAWAIVEPYFKAAEAAAIEQYHHLAANGLASNDWQEVLPAAHYGRVQVLFTALDRQQWGRFNEATGQVTLNPEPQPGDRELINEAAVHTFLNRGTVYALESQRVPGGREIAAIFRY